MACRAVARLLDCLTSPPSRSRSGAAAFVLATLRAKATRYNLFFAKARPEGLFR
jgi:hypothetical protein